MKKNIIALIISATLIGGMGTTAYASVGPNVTSKTYCNDYQVDNNKDKLLGEMNKQGLIKFTCSGGYEDVKNNCVKYFQRILSGNKGIESTTNIEENNTAESNSGVDTVSQEANTQVNDCNGQVSQSEVNTSTSDGQTSQVVKAPNIESSKVVSKTETTKPTTTTSTTETKTPAAAQAPATNVSDSFMAKVEQLIYQRVNQERAKAGVSTLTYNNTMEHYARYKSQDMGDKGYFDHQDPQGNLITVKMQNEGVNYKAWGENIAYIGGVSDENALATQFMDNWMNSPGHRANILSTNFSSIGVGVYKIGNKVYATQEFYK